MSVKVMNDLPTELLIAILRKVDQQESLKNAALTCKLWKELIESSCSWSLSLDHQNEVGSNEPWLDYMLTTKRKFHKIKIVGLVELGKNRIIDIFRKHGTHITKLFVFESCLDRFDLFVEVLKCMPNLEHLILYEITTPCTVADVPTEDNLPELLKLKTVELVESEGSIIKCLNRSKLTELKVLNYAYKNQPLSQEPVLDLFRAQPQIKTLALRSIDYGATTLFQTDIMDGTVKFQLNKLSLLDIKLRESPNDYNNLLKFLKPQAKTIKFLELGTTFPDLVYEFVFAKFRNLKTLRLMMNELPKDIEFYERLEENPSITQLIFMDSPPPNHLNDSCPPSLKEFIRHVPNVTDLTLLEDTCDRGTLQFIASNLKNLTRLTVAYFNEITFNDLQFPSLKTLCIDKIEDDVDWEKFSKNNANITEILIHSGTYAGFSDWLEESCSDFIEKMTKILRLEKLVIGSPFRTNEHFYEHIREFGTNLKLIDLHKTCALSIDIMHGIPGLRFHDDDFPAPFHTPEFWNDEDYDGRLPDIDRGGNWDDGENFLDPFEMHLMDIDDYDYEYDQHDDYDGYDDFVDEFDESDFDEY
ncbi:uncharacterized protein LOC119081747 [Bradysia coprophila]|uniref:uncharacterized protein LOC119081747 n=1 Tax=Bradysia coprophila TaxID=38358 RepID=UPI00187DAE68|nr:uncharacterized protein LOC119081747 [Bradysia coprophila]